MIFLEYPKCTTCKKAKKWLEENNIQFDDRNITQNNPSFDELKLWYQKSKLPIKKFINTSGMKYRELSLKDKLPQMNDDEIISLLSTDGMLVKRPIIVDNDTILVGFNESLWSQTLIK